MKTRTAPDALLFVLCLLATAIGTLFIFDAGYVRALQSEGTALPKEFKTQLWMTLAGLVAYGLACRAEGRTFERLAKAGWGICLVMLLFVDLFGQKQNEAQRWLKLGPITLQPSEFAKIGLILLLAATFANRKAWPSFERFKPWFHRWEVCFPLRMRRIAPGVVALLGVYLTERGKDLGTAAVLLVILGAMCVLGGVRGRTLLVWGAFLGLITVYMVAKEPYRMERFANHTHRWDPKVVDDEGFQSAQAEVGMASGGLTGVGLGRGRTKHIIPAPTTDYVMATVAEETGLIGASLVLLLLGGIVARLLILARRAENRFAAMVLAGTACWLTVQTCVNVMMANATLPSIGIPVPFISSGGSSLIALWLAIGVCQSVVRVQKVKRVQEETGAAGADRRRYGRAYLSGA
ncbi:hypothetical protein BH11ARM2_BH11ARM2_17070 [soil metagenome]